MKSTRAVGRSDRRTFSAEFKAESVRLVTERPATGGSLAQVGRELDVRANQLRAREARERAGDEGALPGGTLY
jgi:transposase-like protein